MAAARPPAPYALLFSVEVRHAYYDPPTRLRMRVEPDAATRTWMARAGCVARTVGNVLQVWFEAERNGPWRHTTAVDDGAFLRFGVYAADREFPRFTDGLPSPDRPPLTYCTLCATEDGGLPPTEALDWVWSEGPRPDLVVVAPMAGPYTPRVAAPGRPAEPARGGRLARPAEPAVEAVEGRAYRIELRSRESRWKYYLLGDWRDPSIVDRASDAIAFEAAADATLPDGRVVRAFRARAPLPLQERFDARFELHAAAPPGGVPIRRLLPTPATANLARDADLGPDQLVSEIFVPS